MIRIRLVTSDGREVEDVFIPPFRKLPEVLVWGARMFSFHRDLKDDADPCSAEYREVFAYWIPPGEYGPDFDIEGRDK
jgi:hypothetical protein